LVGLEGTGIALFKKFDEKKASLNGEFTIEQLKAFINERAVPLFNLFVGNSKVFSYDTKVHVFVFSTPDDQPRVEKLVRDTAEPFRAKAIFSFVDVEAASSARICEYFQVTKENTPLVFLFNLTDQGVKKFRPDSVPSDPETLAAFINSFFSGKVEPFLKTEEPVAYDGKGVRVLCGKDHDSVLSDKSKFIFVEYYAPWCGHCQKLAPEWEKLGAHFEGRDDILIAKMDAAANEVPSVNIFGFPTLNMYTKDDNLIAYRGDRTFEALLTFVTSVLDGTYTPPAEEEEEEDDYIIEGEDYEGEEGDEEDEEEAEDAEEEGDHDHAGHDHAGHDHGHDHDEEHEDL